MKAGVVFVSILSVLFAIGAESPFEEALRQGEEALQSGKVEDARPWIQRALERDPQSVAAWDLRARAAEALSDRDDAIFARHHQLRLLIAQKQGRTLVAEHRKRLIGLDPLAKDLLDLREVFIEQLEQIAQQYEKEKRPHSAIRIHQQVLALDPEFDKSLEAVDRISATRDPSLAETARPKDLFEGISDEWIREFDEEHSSWDERAKLEREHYVTHTDAGYRVLVRAAEAMEQMNAFYREFFQYGGEGDDRSVPRIALNIFKSRDEYLKLGIGPPVEWSGGHFTGSAVETFVGQGGFETMIGTLFHEAAHQFVSLATNAVGWLNEGLASFFEGCRILANGTVLMNYPANHRLFPLATRMEEGWMSGPADGIDPTNSSSEPTRAPTFRILIENDYAWGPPWYAPTWGLVYFLYNFQDPWDGRFVYRKAFREYIDVSGGRSGKGAIEAFEETVLLNPAPPTKNAGKKDDDALKGDALPRTVDAVDELWKEWTLKLRDQQSGKVELPPPYLEWARLAIERGELDVAQEHFEKGLVATPENVDLLVEFAKFLGVKKKNGDRASKLLLQAIVRVEQEDKPDDKKIADLERLLSQFDQKRRSVERIHEQLEAAAKNLAQRYLAAELPMMAMEVSWRLGNELGFSSLFAEFEQAARKCGKSLEIWKLAYNERNLESWLDDGEGTWNPDGAELHSKYGEVTKGNYDYRFLTMDTVTSGDFSFEAELFAEESKNTFAGLVFGRKDGSNFHTLVFFPGRSGDTYYGKQAQSASVDLTTFFGSGVYKVWRHNPVGDKESAVLASWHKLGIDVTGRLVDVWFDDGLVVTHEFATTDVLRGGFGLFTGRGEARWRNIRYVSRKPHDPGAKIQRDLVMERLRIEAEQQGRVLGDSRIGAVPPFPTVQAWVQNPRESWEDRGPMPTLLVLWSIQQNEALPIDQWLSDVLDKNRASRLEILSICSFEDKDRVSEYMESHPFPGSVGVDELRRGTKGYGTTFERYAAQKFHLPRLLLLDINHEVVWEGDPGFEMAVGYVRGMESYLDAPLKDLIDRRGLLEFYPWIEQWEKEGRAQFEAGEIMKVAPMLARLEHLGDNRHPEVMFAFEQWKILRSALGGIEVTAHSLAGVEGEAALETLLEWAPAVGIEISPETRNQLKPHLQRKSAADWRKALDLGRELRRRLKPDDVSAAKTAVSRLKELKGLFCEIFTSQMRRATDFGNYDGLVFVIDDMTRIPERWLAEEFFHWSSEE